MTPDDRDARMLLAATVEPGLADVAALVAEHGAPAVWRAICSGEQRSGWARRAGETTLHGIQRATSTAGARFVVPGDDEWPAGLDDLSHVAPWDGAGGPPLGLWLRGAPLAGSRAVAVVGSRACSAYGESVALELAHELSRAGHAIVSGGAFGIDAAAHRGALAAGGTTTAVLACGVDEPYPRSHASLFAQIAERGTLVSEHAPGAHPTRARFLARNRLIAALAAGTVMVEAAARSGARNTLGWAARLNRVAMAVPGPVTSAQSVTPHRLIRDGEALLVASAAEVRAAVSAPGQDLLVEAAGEIRVFDELTALQRAVLEQVPARGSRSADELVALTGERPPAVYAALAALEERALVEARADGGWGLGRRRADATTRAPSRARTEGAA